MAGTAEPPRNTTLAVYLTTGLVALGVSLLGSLISATWWGAGLTGGQEALSIRQDALGVKQKDFEDKTGVIFGEIERLKEDKKTFEGHTARPAHHGAEEALNEQRIWNERIAARIKALEQGSTPATADRITKLEFDRRWIEWREYQLRWCQRASVLNPGWKCPELHPSTEHEHGDR